MSADSTKPTALSPEDAAFFTRYAQLFDFDPGKTLVRIIRDLDARLVAAEERIAELVEHLHSTHYCNCRSIDE